MADSRSPKATMSEFLKNIDCFTYVVLAGIGHLTILYFSCFSCFCKIHFLLVDEQAQVTIYSISSVATLWQSRPLSLRSIVKFYSPLTIMTNTIPGLHRKMRKLSTIVILTCVDRVEVLDTQPNIPKILATNHLAPRCSHIIILSDDAWPEDDWWWHWGCLITLLIWVFFKSF